MVKLYRDLEIRSGVMRGKIAHRSRDRVCWIRMTYLKVIVNRLYETYMRCIGRQQIREQEAASRKMVRSARRLVVRRMKECVN